MHVTEMLITGFDGDEPVFAVNLASTGAEENDEPDPINAFEAIYGILDRLPKVAQGSNL